MSYNNAKLKTNNKKKKEPDTKIIRTKANKKTKNLKSNDNILESLQKIEINDLELYDENDYKINGSNIDKDELEILYDENGCTIKDSDESDYEFDTDFDFGLDFEDNNNNNNNINNYDGNNSNNVQTNTYVMTSEELNNLMSGIGTNNQINYNVQTNQNTNQNQNFAEVFKIFEKIFNNPQTQQQIQEQFQQQVQQQKQINQKNQENKIIHVRKEGIMANFEHQIKQQLIEIIDGSSCERLKKKIETFDTNLQNTNNKEYDNDNTMNNSDDEEEFETEEQRETTQRLNSIIKTIEADEAFIGIDEDEMIEQLKTVPNQYDFDDFCKELEYGKKLTYTNSTRREKLFTIMYTIGNYCIEPNIDIKRIILFIIKFEVLRNDLISRIIKMNQQTGRCDVLDCITSDMLFTGLGLLLSTSNMKIVSKNIAYYFAKIFY